MDELASLPDVLTARHISDYLHVTTRQVYIWMATAPEHGGLRSFSIGRVTRAYKTDFISWINEKASSTANQHGGYLRHKKAQRK